jgi:ADP-heptose:LPS heptosyltransferase
MLLSGFQPEADEPPAQTEPENKISRVKNILVVRQHNQIGDMLCSLTLYAALKKKYPDSSITLVAAKTNYEIPFIEINPYLDRVIIFDKQNPGTLLKFLRKLRESKYQIGVVPSTIKVSRTSHIINFLSGAKVRVGVKSIDGALNPSHKLLNVKSGFAWKNTHQLERNLEVVKQINCNLSEEDKTSLKFRYSDEDKSFARNFIEENFPGNHRKVLGFHPGAGKADNMWSTNRFIELIKKIYDRYNNYVLLTSGKIDKTVIVEVETEMKKAGIPFKILNDFAIKKLGAILSLIDLYITNDTGSMHIAGFSDAKMISLFGPTNPNEWAPAGENKYFIKSKNGNINNISVDEVYNLTEKILEEAK